MTRRSTRISPIEQGQRLVPMIRLRGLWLEEHGFTKGRVVEIEAREGRITLTLRDEVLTQSPSISECYPRPRAEPSDVSAAGSFERTI